MTRVIGRAGPIVALAALSCACEAVPTLKFEQPEAALDAAEESRPPAGMDAGGDGCADPATAQTYVCCGAVACVAPCTGLCNVCIGKCTQPGLFCCPKPNNVQCLPTGMPCR